MYKLLFECRQSCFNSLSFCYSQCFVWLLSEILLLPGISVMVLVYFLRTVTESDSDDSGKKAKPCRRHAGWYMCKQINMFSICDRSILEVMSARVLFALRLCVTSVDCSQMVVSYSDHIQTPQGYWSLSWLFACQTPSKIVVPFFGSCRCFQVNRYMLSA